MYVPHFSNLNSIFVGHNSGASPVRTFFEFPNRKLPVRRILEVVGLSYSYVGYRAYVYARFILRGSQMNSNAAVVGMLSTIY